MKIFFLGFLKVLGQLTETGIVSPQQFLGEYLFNFLLFGKMEKESQIQWQKCRSD